MSLPAHHFQRSDLCLDCVINPARRARAACGNGGTGSAGDTSGSLGSDTRGFQGTASWHRLRQQRLALLLGVLPEEKGEIGDCTAGRVWGFRGCSEVQNSRGIFLVQEWNG